MPVSSITTNQDPDLFNLSHHAEQLRRYGKGTAAATIVMGAELLKLREKEQPKLGRPKKGYQSSPFSPEVEKVPWKDRVTYATGFSWETCRRAYKTAEKVIQELEKAKEPHLLANAKILRDPPAEWSPEDYDGLAQVIDGTFEADTLGELFIEMGVVRDPTRNLTGAKPAKDAKAKASRIPFRDEAKNYFKNFRQALATDRADGKLYEKRLKALPTYADDPEIETGLIDIKDELEAHVQIVKAEIARRGEA